MGACICKCCSPNEDDRSNSSVRRDSNNSAVGLGIVSPIEADSLSSCTKRRIYTVKMVDSLIVECLSLIGKLGLSGYNQESPDALQRLNVVGDQEEGWLQIILSLINIVPVENPLGPAVITVVLDDCPLPNKDTVIRLCKAINLAKYTTSRYRKCLPIHCHRNICVIFGVLAEKLPGPSSIALLTPETIEYIIMNLDYKKTDPIVTLFSLIVLEKFAQITENKIVIQKYMDNDAKSALMKLESLLKSDNYVEIQVGFSARWLLDNIFPVKSRKLSYLCSENSNLHAMLNTRDTSEYLKISPDGLEARCDAYSFESVRCTFQITSGVWYYEATLITSGVMQIGWATIDSLFKNHEGYGIGDDECSIAYDGCRQQLWFDARNEALEERTPWKAGDVVGCLINVSGEYVSFYLNGCLVTENSNLFTISKSGFFAAASFMAFQHCRFNFGSKPFKYPPKDEIFSTFNDHGKLTDAERIVLPRHVQFQQMQNIKINDDSCIVCYDNKATITLEPCRHSGFCTKCFKQFRNCPVCRRTIEGVTTPSTMLDEPLIEI